MSRDPVALPCTVSSPSIAPDERSVAYVADAGGRPRLWLHDLRTDTVRRLATREPVRSVAWSPCGAWLAYDTAGADPVVGLLREDGRDHHIAHPPGATSSELAGWSPDGRLLLGSSNTGPEGTLDAWAMDVVSSRLVINVATGAFGTVSDVSPDGALAAITIVRAARDREVALVEIPSGRRRTACAQRNAGDVVGGACFSHDGRSLFVCANVGRETTALATTPIADDGAVGPLRYLRERAGAELELFSLSADRASALLSWHAQGGSELELLGTSDGEVRRRLTLPHAGVWGAQLAPSASSAALVLAEPGTPPSLWTVDLRSGEMRRRTGTRTGTRRAARASRRPELVRFPAHDGLQLSGWLYRPSAACGPRPCVLSFHGGPAGEERPGASALYESLLDRGISVLAPNVRGSTGFGRTFERLDDGALRFDARRDVGACLEFARTGGIADSRRVGVMGASYGAYLALCGAIDYPDRVAAVASVSGIVDLVSFLERTEPWMRTTMQREFGSLSEDRALLQALSPITGATRISCPVLVVHGDADRLVPPDQAQRLVAALRPRGVPLRCHMFAGEGHEFLRPANRLAADRLVARWLTRHLVRSRGHG